MAKNKHNCIGSLRLDQPVESVLLSFLFADLVDGNRESWLNVSLHIFLPVVAEKARSF